MALQRIYDRILDFPVFQGVGLRDLEDIIFQTKFDFHTIPDGKKIIESGDKADKLFFLLSGKVLLENESDDHSYKIIEEITIPMMLQPEAMFGYSQRFSFTVTSLKKAGIMTVDKSEVMKFLDRYPIVRLNMVNLLATHVQQLSRRFWRKHGNDLTQRLIDFLASRCVRPAGKKIVRTKMTQLADELNDSRLNVSDALNKLDDDGLIRKFRGGFEIPAMELLINRDSLKH